MNRLIHIIKQVQNNINGRMYVVDIWVLTAALCKSINKMFRKVERKKKGREGGKEKQNRQTWHLMIAILCPRGSQLLGRLTSYPSLLIDDSRQSKMEITI